MNISMFFFITFFVFFSLILFSYIILVIYFMRGWRRLPSFSSLFSPQVAIPNIAVVVACKNEAAHLPILLQSLSQQTVLPSEIILIDDHSNDETPQILQKYAETCENVRFLSASGNGKKAALTQGIISAVNAKLILCTDADCILLPTWIEMVATAYQQEKFDMLILPVKIQGETFFARLQTFEFSTLIASGAAMAALHKPIMCNGANLAFSRKCWLESVNDLHPELDSGDDVFLLHSFKKKHRMIRFLKSKTAMVETNASSSLSAFIRQRARWASKAGSYTDKDTIVVAALVALVNFLILALAIGAFFSFHFFVLLLVAFLLKWFLDGVFLQQIKSFFGLPNIFVFSFLLSLLYPFYVFVSVLKGLNR